MSFKGNEGLTTPHHSALGASRLSAYNMYQSDIVSAYKVAGGAYQIVNDRMSEGICELIDMAYPNHDGVQDPDVIADMMILRDTLQSLSKACEIWTKQLTEVIQLDGENQ